MPITSGAIAAVMLDHLSGRTTHRQATYVDESSSEDYVGADFRYHGGGEDDGDLVRVTLQRGKAPACAPGEHCADLGGGARLHWELEEPEEDPGIVAVTFEREGTLAVALVSGPTISRSFATTVSTPSKWPGRDRPS